MRKGWKRALIVSCTIPGGRGLGRAPIDQCALTGAPGAGSGPVKRTNDVPRRAQRTQPITDEMIVIHPRWVWGKKVRVANMLPALIFAMAAALLFS